MPRCFLVMGVPRSGTSAVAGILHRLGIDMGPDYPANEWNPKGFHHDREFERLLWGPMREEFPGWPFSPGDGAEQITALAASRMARGHDWGVKSNRLAYCLSAFLAGVGRDNLTLITTSRPIEESVASWAMRSGKGIQAASTAIERARRAISESLALHKVSPALTVDYGDLVLRPSVWVNAIAACVGRPANAEAVSWIDASLRRVGNGN